ncbi:hypothetical protein EBZ39_03615 [bacterium]|nr:hypothetical protein [bacterium]
MYPTWWEYPKGRIKVKRGDVVRVGRGSIVVGAVETGHLREWLEGVMNARFDGDLDIMWAGDNVPEEVVQELDRNGEKAPVPITFTVPVEVASLPAYVGTTLMVRNDGKIKNVKDVVFEEGGG